VPSSLFCERRLLGLCSLVFCLTVSRTSDRRWTLRGGTTGGGARNGSVSGGTELTDGSAPIFFLYRSRFRR
jgi:hypothetical protein